MSDRTVIRGTVVVHEERCKGCELCVPACPPGVLVMSRDTNELGFRYPLLLEGCTGCRACYQVCPDYVFDVYKYDAPVVAEEGPEPSSGDRRSGGAGADAPGGSEA